MIEPDRDENVLEAIRSAVPDVGLSPTETERIYDAVLPHLAPDDALAASKQRCCDGI